VLQDRPSPDHAPPSGTGPLDCAAICERCMGNTTLVQMLLDRFEKQAIDDVATLTRLLGEGGPAVAARIGDTAHALKGAAGAIAVAGVHSAAADIERAARCGSLDSLPALLQALRGEVVRCLEALPAVRASLQPHPEN